MSTRYWCGNNRLFADSSIDVCVEEFVFPRPACQDPTQLCEFAHCLQCLYQALKRAHNESTVLSAETTGAVAGLCVFMERFLVDGYALIVANRLEECIWVVQCLLWSACGRLLPVPAMSVHANAG